MASLNVVGKVVVDPASVAKIGNLDADDVNTNLVFFGFPLVAGAGRAARRGGGGGGFAEADAGHFFGKDVSTEVVSLGGASVGERSFLIDLDRGLTLSFPASSGTLRSLRPCGSPSRVLMRRSPFCGNGKRLKKRLVSASK